MMVVVAELVNIYFLITVELVVSLRNSVASSVPPLPHLPFVTCTRSPLLILQTFLLESQQGLVVSFLPYRLDHMKDPST